MKKHIKFKLVFKRHGHISGVDAPDYVFVIKTLDQIADSSFVGYFDNESYYTLVATLLYTGLKDKKGTDIFEGDLLKRLNGEIDRVEFDTGQFVVIHKNGDSDYIAVKNQFEIIGNIYENKKLA